jgi:hypothetical protein
MYQVRARYPHSSSHGIFGRSALYFPVDRSWFLDKSQADYYACFFGRVALASSAKIANDAFGAGWSGTLFVVT